MSGERPARPRRAWFAAAAAASALIATVFATVGDGVEVPTASGVRAVVIDAGHTLVWLLLALAFLSAAVRGRWGRLSQVLALAAGGLYLLFLSAVFLWP